MQCKIVMFQTHAVSPITFRFHRSVQKSFGRPRAWKNLERQAIKGSREPTHGSVCSVARKLQSMDVLKLQSAKADWNTKCSFHILAYTYSNLLAISTSYFIKILSYNERLDVDSQRTKKCTLYLDFRGGGGGGGGGGVYRNLRPRKLRPRKLRPRKLRPRKLRPRKLRPRNLRSPNNFRRKALFSSFSRQSISVASAECLKSVKNLKTEEFQKVEN